MTIERHRGCVSIAPNIASDITSDIADLALMHASISFVSPQAPSPLPAQESPVPPPSDAVVSVDTVLSSSPRAETSGLLTLRRLPVSLRTSGPISGRRQALACIEVSTITHTQRV
jgi:hypothetical protein